MLEIALHNPRQHRQFQHDVGPLLLARIAKAESLWRTVDEERSHDAEAVVEIVPETDGIRLQTTGCEQECSCGRVCAHLGEYRLELPAKFSIGDTRFEVADATSARARPLEVLVADKSNLPKWPGVANGLSPATLSRWFGALGTLHRGTNSTQEFFVQAARVAVESIGLDGAMVLRRRDGQWEIVASYLPHPEFGIHCDMPVLGLLVDTPQTLFHGTNRSHDEEPPAVAELEGLLESLERDEQRAVVVSPLTNAAGELIGAIYGFRTVRAGNSRRGIRYLEAHLIELLAGAVSDGIARIEHEAEVDRRRVLLEQALAAKGNGESSPLPVSEQREVTLLFADLRGFAKLADSLGIDETCALLSDVMDALTAAVFDHDGMIIDYYGDGLAAMWNAPADQPDHPELACRAALRMIEVLPAVEAKWADVLTEKLRLGVGVHTGVAQVGNSGSKRKWKYGPRGANVHLASRIEAATKELGVPLVVSQVTASRLSNRFVSNRLCRAELPGISKSVDLYGVQPAAAQPDVLAELAEYGRALELFEAGRWKDAAQSFAKLDASTTHLPVAFLTSHVERLLREQQGRRSSDHDAAAASSVIALQAK